MFSALSPAALARASARRPWRVVAIWGALLVASIAVVAVALAGALTTETSFVNSPESKRAADAIEHRLGSPAPVVESVIVRSPSRSVDDPAVRQAVTTLAGRIRALGPTSVTAVATPWQGGDASLVSGDRHVAIVAVTMAGTIVKANEHVGKVLDLAKAQDGRDGLAVRVAGQASINHDVQKVAESDLSRGEAIGIPVALVILLLVFGAAVSALLPVMLSVVAIVVSLALTAIVGHVFELSFFVTNMITMMGLAVGIDYVLFIVSRYREERAAGKAPEAAIEAAGATASRAVLFSGLTVVVALVGMLIVPTTIFVSLATGAILVVLAALAAALTLLPAVLSLLRDRIERGSVSRLLPRGGTAGLWPRAIAAVMRRPVLSLVGTAAVLVVASIPYWSIQTGQSGVSTLPASLQSRQGFEILQRDFSVGRIAPAQVVLATDTGTARAEAARITAALRGDSRYGTPVLGPGNVLSVPVNADAAGTTAEQAVRHLRDVADSPVGGATSQNIDYFDIVDSYLPIVVSIVLALSFLVLLVAFRSLVVPFVAILMNLLSVGAAYGLLVLVTQKGYGAGLLGFHRVDTIEAWIPLFLFSVLFGLSMDYHVFLLSRIRERYGETGSTEDAVTHGITSSARLITGAALIMVAVFSGFAAGDLVMFQQMGFGLAVAVLVDATLVRTILVPATMTLLGRHNWYLPSFLGWLPRVSVEGEAAAAPAAGD
jgi:RND superfamily putative drug exporter